MMEAPLLPFQLPFMQDAFLASLLIALPCGLLSPILVLKGWALIGDAIAHAVLPGIVLAYIFGLPYLLGAFVAGLGAAHLGGWLNEHSHLKSDTLLGVVFSSMFALGLLLLAQFAPSLHLEHILYGNLLGVQPTELKTAAAICVLTVVTLFVLWRSYVLFCFDPVQARALGLPTKALHNGLIALTAATVVAALSATGLILSIALLITPGATALLLTHRFHHALMLSGAIACFAALCGTYTCFWLNSAPAATIVCFLTAFFLIALMLQAQKADTV